MASGANGGAGREAWYTIDTTYYWRVNASSDHGASEWSETWQFQFIVESSLNNSTINIPQKYMFLLITIHILTLPGRMADI